MARLNYYFEFGKMNRKRCCEIRLILLIFCNFLTVKNFLKKLLRQMDCLINYSSVSPYWMMNGWTEMSVDKWRSWNNFSALETRIWLPSWNENSAVRFFYRLNRKRNGRSFGSNFSVETPVALWKLICAISESPFNVSELVRWFWRF